jgi:probable addiction module antidote protein
LRDRSDDARERLLIGLGYVARAYGMAALTKKIGCSPKALYLAFSKTGNPTLEIFLSVINELGVQLRAEKAGVRKGRVKKV